MHEDLLRQARRLASLDSGRPRQANLRRAVSAAYYALFHFMIDASCRQAIGSHHSQSAYRQVLGRAFSHSTMREACRSFGGGALKASVLKGLPAGFTVPLEIRQIAEAFVALQQLRHLADYDLTERFLRSEVFSVIQRVETVIHTFRHSTTSDEKTFFLACLWAWNGLSNR